MKYSVKKIPLFLSQKEIDKAFLAEFAKFDLKSAIVLNLFISFFTVSFSLLFRMYHLESGEEILINIWVVFNLLAGSLIGSYFGTNMMLRIDSEKLKSFVFLLMALYFYLV